MDAEEEMSKIAIPKEMKMEVFFSFLVEDEGLSKRFEISETKWVLSKRPSFIGIKKVPDSDIKLTWLSQ